MTAAELLDGFLDELADRVAERLVGKLRERAPAPSSPPEPPERAPDPPDPPDSPPEPPSPAPEAQAALPTGRSPAAARERQHAVLESLRGAEGRALTRAEVCELTGLEGGLCKAALLSLEERGLVEREGERRGTRYRAKQLDAGGKRPAGGGNPPPGERQKLTDEGKVLGALEARRRSAAEVGVETGLPLERVRGLLGKLVKEGDVRMFKGGEYTAVL